MIYTLEETAGSIPPANSLFWERVTLDLLRYLSSPRNMEEIHAWGKEHDYSNSMSKNMIAWLSFTGKIHNDRQTQNWVLGGEY